MKKISKVIGIIAISALASAMCLGFAACGDDDEVGEDGVKSYSVDVDGSLAAWEYNFVNINSYGDNPFGILNIEDWGNKKLKLGSDNTCAGTGCTWSVQLDIMDDTEYNLYLTAHIIGNDTVYGGEGDFTYMFDGTYEEVSGGYKLEAPTYIKVSLTGDFTLLEDDYDFANYIPSADWEIDSNMSDDDEFITGLNNNSAGTKGLHSKLLPSELTTIFGGGTFYVSGSTITSITDVTFPM